MEDSQKITVGSMSTGKQSTSHKYFWGPRLFFYLFGLGFISILLYILVIKSTSSKATVADQISGRKLVTSKIGVLPRGSDSTNSYTYNCIFSNDGTHYACVKYTIDKAKKSIINTGKEEALYDEIVDLQFSRTSHDLYYIARDGKEYYLVKNGVPSKPYEYIDNLVVSPDGNHIAFTAGKGIVKKHGTINEWVESQSVFVVRDGLVGKHYDGQIMSQEDTHYFPKFSYDSKNIVYSAVSKHKPVLVLNDREIFSSSNTSDAIEFPIFSLDTSRIIFLLNKKLSSRTSQSILEEVNPQGKEITYFNTNPYSMLPGYLSASARGDRIVYSTIKPDDQDHEDIYINDTRQNIDLSDITDIYNLTISPDGKRIAYIKLTYPKSGVDIGDASSSPIGHIFLDGTEIGSFKNFFTRYSRFVFSSDSKILTYRLDTENELDIRDSHIKGQIVVTDGRHLCSYSYNALMNYISDDDSLFEGPEKPQFNKLESELYFGTITPNGLMFNSVKSDVTGCRKI